MTLDPDKFAYSVFSFTCMGLSLNFYLKNVQAMIVELRSRIYDLLP
ncbi:hypothetical protein [Calothrix sp. NIES-3974]|nr:hypothetical protein [Calothrix sp. NIES-3974]BAZ04298.1 hypothetical protein NIES3974_09310 [Calothrix sp. NIES-3974]